MGNINLQTLYEQNFEGWIEQTINHLENGQFDQLDAKHLIEELVDLGRSERRALTSNLKILIAHLLKLKVQHNVPESMKGSWYDSVVEHRQRVWDSLQDSPSLKSYLREAVQMAYPDARKVAIKEGQLAKFGVAIPEENDYPLVCPFGVDQLLDQDFMGIED
jgi:hypothetical protein